MAGAAYLIAQDVYRSSLDPVDRARPCVRSMRGGHGNLGRQFHLCLRREEHVEARPAFILVVPCHPERSKLIRNANRLAESKDP
jgi:hypothetical protein